MNEKTKQKSSIVAIKTDDDDDDDEEDDYDGYDENLTIILFFEFYPILKF